MVAEIAHNTFWESVDLFSLFLSIALIVAAIAGAFFLARLVTHYVRKFLNKTNAGSASIIINLAKGVIAWFTISFLCEYVFGIKMSGIVQALGITTLIVSLGLQDYIKNIVAGVQIVTTSVFSTGDQLDVGSVRGEVLDVGLRQTVMRDKDNNTHVLPNSVLMNEVFMRREGKMVRRYVVECDIKPGLDLDRIADDIATLVDAALDEKGIRAEEPTEVRFLGSTANGVQASIRIFLDDISHTTLGMDTVMRTIGKRSYLADWTNESPAQE
ncbi:MAG: mechanosensitive ion channel family protein, partial [Atopobiaceae bacterium]|nr:mechanosensitive ion channel family protein [Atopobiaceae bacterium]